MRDLRPTVVDLFAGVGGLSLGASRAGFNVVLAVETDNHAIRAHTRNFPDTHHLDKDVADLRGDDILKCATIKNHKPDGIIGGPPCQGFSVMGRQAFGDPRNDLFCKFFELVAECRPKFFIAENVSNIMTSKYDSIREAALAHVSADYEVVLPMRIRASNYGAATSRERVFFVGFLRDEMNAVQPADFEARRVAGVTVEQALAGLPVLIDDNWQTEQESWRSLEEFAATGYVERLNEFAARGIGCSPSMLRFQNSRQVSGCFGTRHSTPVRARYAQLEIGRKDPISKSMRLDPAGFCPTLRAGTGADKGSYQAVRPIHPVEARVITPREAARLQGFPDWFQFAPSKWHSFRQIGNSVCPLVAEAVLGTMREKLY